MKISGNKIIITGASTGIGFALAQKFIENKNTVITIDRNPKNQAMAREKLPDLITHTCDLTDPKALKNLVDWIKSSHSDFNMLINNAGVQFNYMLEGYDWSFDTIGQEMEVNLGVPVKLCHALLPVLSKRPHAAIVNVESFLAFAPKKSAAVYCAAKAGLHIFSQAMRYQLHNTNVKVFEIIPPLVDTKMTSGRGKNKISPDLLAEKVINALKKEQYEIYVGKAKLARNVMRIFPGIIKNKMKYS